MRHRPTFDVEEHRDIAIPGADGTTLLADRYSPVTDEPRPTFLLRTPYGASAPIRMHYGRRMARRGYHAVIQRCRGTYGSGGAFVPMVNEAADGHAAVVWLREQPWFTGRLITSGASYMGFVQWALGAEPPPELVARVIEIAPFDFASWTRPHGSLRLRTTLSWADQVTHQEEHAGLRALVEDFVVRQRRLRRVYDALPLGTAYRTATRAEIPFYESWLEPGLGGLAAGMDASAAVDAPGPPTLIIGGWNDIFAAQAVEAYARQRAAGTHVSLLMGPWTHLGYALGSRQAVPAMLQWFREHVDGGCDAEHGARVHVGGAKAWRQLPSWPPPTEPLTLHLAANGVLSRSVPANDAPPTTFTYDPARPTPDRGGPAMAVRDGPKDTRPIERRPDVVTFTSEPLGTRTEVHGEVGVEVHVTTSSPYADVFARLCDVAPNGRSMHVTDGFVRLTDADTRDADGGRCVDVRLTPTAHSFAAGHRIRLHVCGSAHPRYARNLGTGEPLATGTRATPVRYTVHHDAARPSAIRLPVASEVTR